MTMTRDLTQLANEILSLEAQRDGLNSMISDLKSDMVIRMRLNHQTIHTDDKVKVEIAQRKKRLSRNF